MKRKIVNEMIVEQLIAFFDVLLSPLNIFQNHISILIISIILTIIVLISNRLLLNKSLMKEIKNRMEEVREQLTKAQREGNKENVERFLNEMLKTNNEYMRQNFKSLIVSLVVLSLIVPWLNYKFGGMTVAVLPFSVPFVGSNLTWIYWYILVSFAAGWLIKKLFALD